MVVLAGVGRKRPANSISDISDPSGTIIANCLLAHGRITADAESPWRFRIGLIQAIREVVSAAHRADQRGLGDRLRGREVTAPIA